MSEFNPDDEFGPEDSELIADMDVFEIAARKRRELLGDSYQAGSSFLDSFMQPSYIEPGRLEHSRPWLYHTGNKMGPFLFVLDLPDPVVAHVVRQKEISEEVLNNDDGQSLLKHVETHQDDLVDIALRYYADGINIVNALTTADDVYEGLFGGIPQSKDVAPSITVKADLMQLLRQRLVLDISKSLGLPEAQESAPDKSTQQILSRLARMWKERKPE